VPRGGWVKLAQGWYKKSAPLVVINSQLAANARATQDDSPGKKCYSANLSKYRVLLAGIFSPLLPLVLNVLFIQTLLALSPNPESNWRFRLLVSSLALPVPFLLL
jgi:hypothetical protein